MIFFLIIQFIISIYYDSFPELKSPADCQELANVKCLCQALKTQNPD